MATRKLGDIISHISADPRGLQ